MSVLIINIFMNDYFFYVVVKIVHFGFIWRNCKCIGVEGYMTYVQICVLTFNSILRNVAGIIAKCFEVQVVLVTSVVSKCQWSGLLSHD